MLHIRAAAPGDVPLILSLIRDLAEYEKLSSACVATEEQLHATLFGPRPFAETIIAEWNGAPAGLALFFHNYSTFLAKPGIYLEDLFVKPEFRGNGIGKGLLVRLAQIAEERGCGRIEWSVLNWNEPAIGFYRGLGATPQDEWTVYRMTGDAIARLARQG